MTIRPTPLDSLTSVRILQYGDTGTGKTRSAIKLAHDGARVFLIDPRDGVRHTAKEFKHLKRLVYFLAPGMPQIRGAWQWIQRAGIKKNEDWVCLDELGVIWELSMVDFIRRTYGKKLSDYYIAQRKMLVAQGREGEQAISGFYDWPGIKRVHNTDLLDAINMSGANVVCNTGAEPLDEKRDFRKSVDAARNAIFTQVGFKPHGEKNNPYRYDVILFLTRRGVGNDAHYFVTAVKNRGGKLFANAPVPRKKSAIDIWRERGGRRLFGEEKP